LEDLGGGKGTVGKRTKLSVQDLPGLQEEVVAYMRSASADLAPRWARRRARELRFEPNSRRGSGALDARRIVALYSEFAAEAAARIRSLQVLAQAARKDVAAADVGLARAKLKRKAANARLSTRELKHQRLMLQLRMVRRGIVPADADDDGGSDDEPRAGEGAVG
jgi:hypothetical protein